MPDQLEDRVQFDFIRYANCWEDADILYEALQPAPGKRILSIASGGDNCFALAAGGAEVVAADLNTSQLACMELKMAAIRRLSREEVLAFLGVTASTRRLETYAELKSDLSAASREYLDEAGPSIEAAIIHAGKFERYFHLFRRRVLPLVHSRRKVKLLLQERSPEDRKKFYDKDWNTVRWRLLFKVFFSKMVMGKLGRDPEFFRYVEGSVADRILERAAHALTDLPTHDNPYLEYILTGNYENALPRYLRESEYEAVREGLGRITLKKGFVQDVGQELKEGGFDGFNLSDIFEYLDADTCEAVYGQLLDVANPGARLAYWNMLVPRGCPEAFQSRVSKLEVLSKALFEKDSAFFYSAFVVDEVTG